MTATPSAASDAGRPLFGIFLVALTTLFFALTDVFSKQLTMAYPVPVVMAIRYFTSFILLTTLFGPRMGKRLWATKRTRLVLGRAGILTLASLTMGHALRLMPVGETIAILYLSPFAVMALAVPILGEKITPWGVFFAILGFCGVLLVLRPGSGLDPVGVLWALGNASCATAFHLLTRSLSRTETAISMLFFVTLVGTVFFVITAIPHMATVRPPLRDLGLMAFVGITATSGHFLFAVAYREAPAAIIAPLNYLHLVWAALLGWAIFNHTPDGISVAGMAIIVGAGAALAVNGHISKTKP